VLKIKEINIDGYVVLIDDEDYEYVTECYNVKINDHGYVHCSPKKKWKGMGLHSMTLHKLLMNPEKKGRNVVVDHRDGNKLNNQKDNLRVTTHMNNMRNRKLTEGKTSEYKGVSWHKESGKWRCQITIDSYNYNLGAFSNEIAAANCYNYWAKKHFKEFALLNECPLMEKEEWESLRHVKNKTSEYRGVSLINGKWYAQIYHNKKNVLIGIFNDEDAAALAYNEKAKELKGEKAKLNDLPLIYKV
jgi:hypothetical protein